MAGLSDFFGPAALATGANYPEGIDTLAGSHIFLMYLYLRPGALTVAPYQSTKPGH